MTSDKKPKCAIVLHCENCDYLTAFNRKCPKCKKNKVYSVEAHNAVRKTRQEVLQKVDRMIYEMILNDCSASDILLGLRMCFGKRAKGNERLRDIIKQSGVDFEFKKETKK